MQHRTEESASLKNVVVEFEEARIDSIFAEFNQCQLPGAAVGIAIGGQPVYRKGFGLANMELPVVLSPTIRMRIASTTKHFACLGYMVLCEDGKAEIDDSVGKHLPELNPVTRNVSMRQVMGHLSGLRDAFDISIQFSGTERPVTSSQLLALYRDIDDVSAAPGVAWAYNNGGFTILSAAIERIAGRTLDEFLRERILNPVGMYATQIRRWETDFVSNSAMAHMMNSAGAYEKTNFFGMEWTGEGGLVSTVDDMLRWLSHMSAPTVGTAATWKAMRTPQRLANGESTDYGLGLFTYRYRGVDTISHGGSGMGGNSQMLKVPSAGLDVAVMVNRSDASAPLLVDKIIDACLPNLDPVTKPSAGSLASGVFLSATTGRVVQLYSRDGQQFAAISGLDFPVELGDDRSLRPATVARYLRQAMWLVGDESRPTAIRLSDCGTIDNLNREEPAARSGAGEVAGTYHSGTTSTTAIVSDSETGPRLKTLGKFGSADFTLEQLADRIWRAKSTSSMPWGGILLFDNHHREFRFSTVWTRALSFRRYD